MSSSAGVVRGRLLLIDDEPAIANLIQRSLQRSWDVTCFLSAVPALDILATREFDAIVCDLMMPVMDGMQFADELARRHPALRLRTLFLTGGAATASAEAFLARPDVRSMSKPLSMRDLDSALRDLAGLT